MKGWKRNFSLVGKEILLKLVASEILILYVASHFFKRFCDELNAMMRLIWWGQKEENRASLFWKVVGYKLTFQMTKFYMLNSRDHAHGDGEVYSLG